MTLQKGWRFKLKPPMKSTLSWNLVTLVIFLNHEVDGDNNRSIYMEWFSIISLEMYDFLAYFVM